MTKKDYVKIANVLATFKTYSESMPASPWRQTALEEITGRMADMLAQDNPRFDRTRFLKACGLES